MKVVQEKLETEQKERKEDVGRMKEEIQSAKDAANVRYEQYKEEIKALNQESEQVKAELSNTIQELESNLAQSKASLSKQVEEYDLLKDQHNQLNLQLSSL